MIYIGIDPGWTGAIAIIQGKLVEVIDCPSTIDEMANILRPYTAVDCAALIEKVNPFYKSSAKSAFSFGSNYSAWEAILTCFNIPREYITPRKWQAQIFDSAKKCNTTKEQSFERAIRLFPDIDLKTKRGKILDGRCDALLLAELCRRKEER